LNIVSEIIQEELEEEIRNRDQIEETIQAAPIIEVKKRG
jgi:hypothetical protein